jgi:predicted outer membrane repeat protein
MAAFPFPTVKCSTDTEPPSFSEIYWKRVPKAPTNGTTTRIDVAGSSVMTWGASIQVAKGQSISIVGGVGGGATVLDAKASSRDCRNHFIVDVDGVLSLKNVTLKGGYHGGNSEGGSIRNSGRLRSENVTFIDNVGYKGGAIYSTIRIALSATTFLTNKASSSSYGPDVYASGIFLLYVTDKWEETKYKLNRNMMWEL